ncbi:MAG: hypothetical protein JNM07_12175 [Phycisphaerae bacterium]|nr:hypothetical protein [Phycisphaerae bacterium]
MRASSLSLRVLVVCLATLTSTYGARGQCDPAWEALPGGGADERVRAMLTWDDGGGEKLYVGGNFATIEGVSATCIAVRGPSGWLQVGSGLRIGAIPGAVFALQAFDDGSGEKLYAAGIFDRNGAGRPMLNIARFNGADWEPLDGDGSGPNAVVRALAAFKDSDGNPALIIGGLFTTTEGDNSGALTVNGLFRYDGALFHGMGTGVTGPSAAKGVYALTVYDEGGGDYLYIGGSFTDIDGLACNNIASWDSFGFYSLSGGLSGGVDPTVTCFIEDPSKPSLYVGGRFDSGDYAVNGAAEWRFGLFLPLGQGFSKDGEPYFASTLARFDDGRGMALFAGGYFTASGSTPVAYVARFNPLNEQWEDMGGGVDSTCRALRAFDDGSGPALWGGGHFGIAGGGTAAHIARYRPGAGPFVLIPPGFQAITAGQTLIETVATSGDGPRTFQWRRYGVDLANGGRISGATTDTLTIAPALNSDTGEFDCVITGPCRTITCDPAFAIVWCAGDFNHDFVVDDFDYFDFLNAFFGNDIGADVNGDTSVDDFDYFDFLNAFNEPC